MLEAEDDVLTRDEILAKGCIEKSTRNGIKYFEIEDKVFAKQCSKCKLIKYAARFGKGGSRNAVGLTSECKRCKKEYSERVKPQRQERLKKYYQENHKEIRDKHSEYYAGNKKRIKSVVRKYRNENREAISLRNSLYREQNRELLRERYRIDFKENRDRYMVYKLNRIARKKALPNDLTNTQIESINAHFENACALTNEPKNIHMDHVIPLFIGHGGTTYGNIIPLSSTLNASKNTTNIFIWFELNRVRFGLSQERFDNTIKFISDIYGISPEYYRDYVYWCYANPQDALEITEIEGSA